MKKFMLIMEGVAGERSHCFLSTTDRVLAERVAGPYAVEMKRSVRLVEVLAEFHPDWRIRTYGKN